MKKAILLCWIIGSGFSALADEGMWLPQLLQTLNEKNMKKLGLKINASDIYNINKASLKDAIVSLGGFCTAEVISNQGLLLTNHHCGFDAIQNHSTLENNYIRNGFWAYNTAQELQNEGLTASFIIRIDDVTAEVLKGYNKAMSEKERQTLVDQNIASLKKTARKESYQDILIRPFFDGNQYFLFVVETFKDVRLVGAPPSSIGNYGKDTDNWMWPRHTGDFSLFRIYADKDNHPAAYSPDNKPYQPKKSLSISLDGVAANDFTMVFGFPGRTNEYLYSAAVKQIMTVNDPAKIHIREKALQILDGFMRKDEQIKIQYAAKYASIENAYKKWKGEVLGLNRKDALSKKRNYEALFQQRVNANPAWSAEYGSLLSDLDKAYQRLEPLALARDHYNEILPRIELLGIATDLNALVKAYQKDPASYENRKTELLGQLNGSFSEFNEQVDARLFSGLLEIYLQQPESLISPVLKDRLAKAGSLDQLAKSLYEASAFGSYKKISNILSLPAEDAIAAIQSDPAASLVADIASTYFNRVGSALNEAQLQINQLQRSYMKAQMAVVTEKNFYPDANSTLRVTYGNVKGYQPRDGVQFGFYTYLDGVMEKYKPGDYEFDLPQKLIDLYQKKDFGAYGSQGKQPVCFIAANHTTGGNSGSPALDAYGNLIGLNFDRVWEGTMSDINYDPEICRNIMVDIRYVLFIIDKFADAKNLIAELKLVHPKSIKTK